MQKPRNNDACLFFQIFLIVAFAKKGTKNVRVCEVQAQTVGLVEPLGRVGALAAVRGYRRPAQRNPAVRHVRAHKILDRPRPRRALGQTAKRRHALRNPRPDIELDRAGVADSAVLRRRAGRHGFGR